MIKKGYSIPWVNSTLVISAWDGNLSGWWSVRIDVVNRLVFQIVDDKIEIYACKGHYEDK